MCVACVLAGVLAILLAGAASASAQSGVDYGGGIAPSLRKSGAWLRDHPYLAVPPTAWSCDAAVV